MTELPWESDLRPFFVYFNGGEEREIFWAENKMHVREMEASGKDRTIFRLDPAYGVERT